MENISIGQYRSHDSPKNFAIRVKFSKLAPERTIPSVQFPSVTANPEGSQDSVELAEKKQDDEEEELIIRWQEKLFSQHEFEYFSDPLNCITSLEQKYHEDIENIKRTHGEKQNKRIFTYVDCDDFTTLQERSPVTCAEDEPVTILTEKMSKEQYTNMSRKPFHTMSGLRRRGLVVNEPTEATKNNHVITTPRQHMQIMADLSSRAANAGTGEILCDERIICTIKIDANGLIVTKPDIMEKKEYTVEVYHDIRCIYQYKLEDASVMITKLQKKQESNLFNDLYKRHAQLMQIHVGNELSPLPNNNEVFVHSFFEIVSAKNFEYNNLYVQYVLDLPSGWTVTGGHLFDVTQSCTMNGECGAQFCFPFDIQMQYRWLEDDPDQFLTWPILYLQVFSIDSWQRHRIEGYGYCQIPDVAGSTTVLVNMWRPKDNYILSDMKRFFIGGTRELKDFRYVKNSVDDEDSKSSKFYFNTVTTGSVVVRINSLLQTSVADGKVNKASLKWRNAVKRIGGYVSAVDSLARVLDAFHRARKRMLSARSLLPVPT